MSGACEVWQFGRVSRDMSRWVFEMPPRKPGAARPPKDSRTKCTTLGWDSCVTMRDCGWCGSGSIGCSEGSSIGPVAGGTAVTLHGLNLASGSHYKCSFGGAAPPHSAAPAFTNPLHDFGLSYEEIEFGAEDGEQLRGWWIPQQPGSAGKRAAQATRRLLSHLSPGPRGWAV